jgi:hypothetical protein
LNTKEEYLAETTEAYFTSKKFRNDYFPIVHSELKSFDPSGFKMVEDVF